MPTLSSCIKKMCHQYQLCWKFIVFIIIYIFWQNVCYNILEVFEFPSMTFSPQRKIYYMPCLPSISKTKLFYIRLIIILEIYSHQIWWGGGTFMITLRTNPFSEYLENWNVFLWKKNLQLQFSVRKFSKMFIIITIIWQNGLMFNI